MPNYIRVKGEKCKIHKCDNKTDFNILDMKIGDIIDYDCLNYRFIYRTDTEFKILAREDFEFIIIDTCISKHIEDPMDFYSIDEMEQTTLTIDLCEKHKKFYCMDYLYHDHGYPFMTLEELEDREREELEYQHETNLKRIVAEMKKY